MPRFVGPSIPGVRPIDEKTACEMVKLTIAQAVKLPRSAIRYRVNDADKGGPGRMARRWFNWYARPGDILSCPRSTATMIIAAAKADGLGVTDPTGVTHVPGGRCPIRRVVGTDETIDCITCLVLEARGE
jgi:hypothetical protein